MRIEDYDSACDVIRPADIESALRKRRDGGVNAFWLGRIAGGFPALNILNGDLAHAHYFPDADHPGFASVGGSLGLVMKNTLCFSTATPKKNAEIMNDEIVLFSDALKAAQEFAVSNAMPKCLRWDSLVGENDLSGRWRLVCGRSGASRGGFVATSRS